MKERKRKAKSNEYTCSGSDNTDLPTYDDISNPFKEDKVIDNSQKPAASRVETAEKGDSMAVAQTCHRAGIDAFMTGLCFSVFRKQLVSGDMAISELGNKLYLSGKSLPLQVTKGNFGKESQPHIQRKLKTQKI